MNKLFSNKIIRYLLVGGFSYFIELCVILFCKNVVGTNDITAVAISFWVGLIVAFVLQKIFTFNERSRGRKVVKQSILYGLLVLFNYLFTLFFVGIFTDYIDVVIARTLALIITTIWNFLIYNNYLFKTENKNG
jgi:putative flippase GtrA